MATAEEILATMAEEDGTPSYLVIDNDLRTITIPENVKLLGVEHDKNVQRLHFKMPAKCGEFDLSGFLIRINYINAAGVGDVYPVTDLEVSDGTMTFSWLVGPNAAAAKGSVSFIVCAKLLDADQVVIKEFHTQPSTLPVLEGLETCESVIQTYPDVLEGILLRLDNLEQTGGVSDEQIENAVNKYLNENPISPGVQFETDKTLRLEEGVLSVNTANSVEKDNTLPVTSAAVYTEVGNINALLATI